jgi:hypothetical protein
VDDPAYPGIICHPLDYFLDGDFGPGTVAEQLFEENYSMIVRQTSRRADVNILTSFHPGNELQAAALNLYLTETGRSSLSTRSSLLLGMTIAYRTDGTRI